jgi:hypothetical protein
MDDLDRQAGRGRWRAPGQCARVGGPAAAVVVVREFTGGKRRATAQAWTSTSTRIDLALRAYLSAASAMQSCKPAVKSPSWVYGLVHWVVTARDFANRMDGRAVAERPAWLVTASSWGRITCSRLVPFTDDLTNR